MLNEIILVGRLTNNIVVNTTDKGKKIGNLTLAVPRSFKNMDGLYETDFIPCLLWEEKATLAKDYCHTGDIVGIKGRLQSRIVETEQGKRNQLEVVAERLTFLSSKKASDVKKTDIWLKISLNHNKVNYL